MTSFDWEKVYIIPPYTDSRTVKDVIGFDWDGVGSTGISFREDITLLIFVKSGEVIEWHRQPRNCGAFELAKDTSRKNGFTPEEAVFSVVEEDYGEPWLVLRPAIPAS